MKLKRTNLDQEDMKISFSIRPETTQRATQNHERFKQAAVNDDRNN